MNEQGLWESGYDAMVEDARLYSDFPDMLAKHIKGYVRKEISSRDTYWKERVRKEVEGEIRLFMETMQKRADTVPPQLLLNEVVNYTYDRLQALDNLK